MPRPQNKQHATEHRQQMNRVLVIAVLITIVLLTRPYDTSLLYIFQYIHTPLLTSALGWVTSFRSIIMMLFVLPGLFLWEYRARLKWISPLAMALVITPIATIILKTIVERERPYGIVGTFGTWDSSFPSGHTALAFSAAVVLARVYPRLKGFWYAYALSVALGRMYLQVHYLSDVTAGIAVGLVIGWLALSISSASTQKEVLSIDDEDAELPIRTPAQKTVFATEFRRKLLHMAVGVTVVALVHNNILNIFDLFLILVGGTVLSFISSRFRVPIIYWFLELFERKHTHPGKGAITYMVGCILSLKLFPPDVAYASIIILALGDGFSAIIGPFGSTKTFLSTKKLIEGTLAGIILASIGASWFIQPIEALVAAAFAMTVEATEIKLNNKILSDNILVPLIAGTTVLLMRAFL